MCDLYFQVSHQPIRRARSQLKKKVEFWHQVGLTFFIVSGGPYGLETAVGAMGPGLTLLLVILIPLFWVLPTCLMVSELSSMIPETGGYYTWVRRALGPKWAFQEGWWTLCSSVFDLAIYPVLFVTYLTYFLPTLGGPEAFYLRWIIGAGFAFFALLLNLRGSRLVGVHSFFEMLLVFVPFAVLVVVAAMMGDWTNIHLALANTFSPEKLGGAPLAPAGIAAGVAAVIWNYAGWDNVATYADEVHEPTKTIPKALAFSAILVTFSYVVPLLAGFKASIEPKVWGESSGWPEIASRFGVSWLGIFIAVVAVISGWALFNGQLLYLARVPQAMAKDGLLPKIFGRISPKTGVPTISICVAALLGMTLCGLSLGKVMIVDMLFYTLGLSLEFLALIVLRVKEPTTRRPFKIPLPTWGLVSLAIFPLMLAVMIAVFSVLGADGSLMQVSMVGGAVVAGFAIYAFIPKLNDSRVSS